MNGNLLSIFYSLLLLSLFLTLAFEIEWSANFYVQLYNNTKHTPIYTNSYPIVLIIIIFFILSIIILNLNKIDTIPPLIGVFLISSLYIGIIFTFLFFYHIYYSNNSIQQETIFNHPVSLIEVFFYFYQYYYL